MSLKFNFNKILMLIVLFFPMHYFHLFFVIITIILLGYISFKNDFVVSKNKFLVILLIFGYLMFGVFFRFIYYEYTDFRDFFELVRFIPVFLILLFDKKINKLDYKTFINMINIYIIIDFFISICQFNKWLPILTKAVSSIYSSKHHVEVALGITRRTLGLSTGPGEHGLFLVVLLTILVSSYISFSKNKNLLVIIVLGLFSVLTSQSQTAFIGLLLMNALVFVLYIFKKEKNTKKFRLYFLSLLLLSVGFGLTFFEQLRYLLTLFDRGFGRTSYTKREEKASFLMEGAFNEPHNMFIGWGKTFFGSYSGAMDNEHLYIFLVYGPLVYLLLLLLVIKYILKNFNSKYFYNKIFVILIVIGLPLAWPNSFFFTPKILVLLTILYVNFYNVNEKMYDS